MEMEKKKLGRGEVVKTLLLYVALFFVCDLIARSSCGRETEDHRRLGRRDAYEQASMVTHQRHYIGIGSSPPQCTFKCGKCIPCRPVHVSFPPSVPTIEEYYPEVWRCKCGNRLFMP